MMATLAENPRAVIGGNSPPEPTPLEAFTTHIDDLFAEASNFLDGEPIDSEPQAEAVAALLDQCRKAGKDADKARDAEKRPHLDAGRAVDQAWKPLTAKAELAATTAKKALAPWLEKKDAEQRAAAAAARAEADRLAEEAREAARAAEASNLAARAEAEARLKIAQEAEKAAVRADKAKAGVAGGSRAVGLRSVWSATITDRRAALNHYIRIHKGEFEALIQRLADHDARYGPRTAPGIDFKEERVAQ